MPKYLIRHDHPFGVESFYSDETTARKAVREFTSDVGLWHSFKGGVRLTIAPNEVWTATKY